MKYDVKRWCKRCNVWPGRNTVKRHNRKLLQSHPAAYPMKQVLVGTLGPLSTTEQAYFGGTRQFYTPEACALPNQEAITVTTRFDNEFSFVDMVAECN
ncbi:unnamed protein product [Soboliphyme baturini]|uniref:60S ribosomal protein L40 n=1 Tax=Soboliphyme baturini TaxID=241478 RepID=A0A183I964_9BILA|nr:unnamed protein product [Soboliphyme baturini]